MRHSSSVFILLSALLVLSTISFVTAAGLPCDGILTHPYDPDPYHIVVTPDSNFVYMASRANRTINSWSISPNGKLVTLRPVVTLDSPNPIAISADNKFLYVGYQSVSGGIGQYKRNVTSGRLTSLSPSLIAGASRITSLIAHPNNLLITAHSNEDGKLYFYSRNTLTGQLTFKSSKAVNGNGIGVAASPTHSNLYVSGGSNKFYTFIFNSITGVYDLVSPTGVSTFSSYDLTSSSRGVYVSNNIGTQIAQFRRNSTNGYPIALAPPLITLTYDSLSAFAFKTFLYVTSSNSTEAYGLNILTGNIGTQISNITGRGSRGSVVSPDGKYLFTMGYDPNAAAYYSVHSYRRDNSTGTISPCTYLP